MRKKTDIGRDVTFNLVEVIEKRLDIFDVPYLKKMSRGKVDTCTAITLKSCVRLGVALLEEFGVDWVPAVAEQGFDMADSRNNLLSRCFPADDFASVFILGIQMQDCPRYGFSAHIQEFHPVLTIFWKASAMATIKWRREH
jgi:hypothetical protein